jgi:hypothetical protein
MALALELWLEPSRSSYRLGEPVEVTMHLRNTDASDAWVLTWGTFLRPRIDSRFLFVSLAGREISYEGPVVRYAQPTAGSYLRSQ